MIAATIQGAVMVERTAGTGENENDDSIKTNFLCQFDGIVTWILSDILMNRMIKAEVLP